MTNGIIYQSPDNLERPINKPKLSLMAGWLFKLSGGKIKNQKIADKILTVMAVVTFGLSLVIFYLALV
jgi:hypothetical protein